MEFSGLYTGAYEMSPHNLQIQLQAMAVMVRVEGMKAENSSKVAIGQNPVYDESDFERSACDIDELMQEVSHE